MRLTLRTLLAYLDDTLDPSETKLIGQKVAESAAAQELIERIKRVTRRRSLANPPVFGDESKLDPNTVAAYLSDVLPAEEIAEVEQTCLENDVYLAEVAACHQILTLMLSEPVRVPPTARQRMYRLVKGRESIPYRKPPAFRPTEEPGDKFQQGEVSDTRPVRWPKYLAGAAALALGLAIAVVLAWPKRLDLPKRAPGEPVAVGYVPAVVVVAPTSKPELPAEPPKPEPPKPEPPKPEPPKPEPPKPEPPKPNIGTVALAEPSKDSREVGRMVSPAAVLVQKVNGRTAWERVALDARVATGKELMAMPGSRADIRLDSGMTLSVWGGVPELVDAPLLESVATLHAAPEGLEVDVTLDRGRIVLSNPRAKFGMARIRVSGEVWDVLLGEQSEILVDLFRSYPGSIPFSKQSGGEGPLVEVFLGVTKGKIDLLRKDLPTFAAAAPALIYWDSKKGEVRAPSKLKGQLPSWLPPKEKDLRPYVIEAKAAQDEFSKRMAPKEAKVEVVLTELLNDNRPGFEALGAFGLGAVDAVSAMLDALDEAGRPALRAAAILALRQWCSRKAENDLVVYGLLRGKKNYNETNADKILEMLHSFSDSDLTNPQTYQTLFADMNHEKLTIRSLAFWHLAKLDPDGVRVSQYDPDADTSVREMSIAKWKKRIPNGKLPPKPMGMP